MNASQFHPDYPKASVLMAFLAVPPEYKPAAVQVLQCAACEHLGKCSVGTAFQDEPTLERGTCPKKAA
jgi:hypothetical protein